MSKSINLKAQGPIENFEIIHQELSEPKDNEILISHNYIAINHSDVLFRIGEKSVNCPVILGTEAIGRIEKLGPGLKDNNIQIDSKIIYATGPLGAYTQKRNIDFNYCVVVPEDIDEKILIGCFSKALTAHYLLRRVVRLQSSQTILVIGAASDHGLALCQMSAHYGLNVIGVVKNSSELEVAKENGCSIVILAEDGNFAPEVLRVTKNVGVDVAYDMLGGIFFENAIASMNYFGMLVSCSDIVANKTMPVDMRKLDHKCIFLTRPRLEIYRYHRMELLIAAEDIFELIRKDVLKPYINECNFKDIINIHKDIENGAIIGSCIANVD